MGEEGTAVTPDQIRQTLAQPIRINGLTLKNRMVMGPMAVVSPTAEGAPSEQTIALFDRRARGGIGMIIVGGVGATRVDPKAGPVMPLRVDVDTFVPQLRRVADAVHAHGVPIIAEFVPGMGRMDRAPGRIISASPRNVVVPEDRLPRGFVMPGGFETRTPEEATIAEIEDVERQMIDSAEIVHRAGWDGVEIAAHMSYFAASFISPRSNWRTDRYGGSVENRARMLVNTVRGIRERLGRDFVVGLRITSNDFMPDGQGPAGFAAVAKEVEKAGIDYVALSPGCYEAMNMSMVAVDGQLVDSGDARVFKDLLSVPVLVQGLHDPARAARAIADGNGDLVMLARQMLADPDYPRKVVEGRIDQITRCDRDNQCIRRLMIGLPIRCSVNPEMGRESRAGGRPPLRRLWEAPKERAMFAIASSRPIMALAMRAARRKVRAQSR
jgi:2,4-dienoyl-CoA reductase (NADPH2)